MAPSGLLFLIFDVHYDGLKIIENESKLEAMYDYAHEYDIIHVYITHGLQDLSPYYVENVSFYGSDDDVKSRRKTVLKDAGNMSVEELVSLAEEEADMASKSSDDDIYEEKASRNTTRTRNSGIVIGENVNTTFSEDDDTDNKIDMEQRFKGSAEFEEMYKEHEEYMDTLMHQLRGKGDGLTYPFTILENDQSNEKFLIHNDQTHWKIRKPKVGEKYDDAAQLKECLTYYSLANGFSLWFYRSLKEMLITRCRKRHEKLKDIEKRKQRKHINYPICGRNKSSNCPFICYGKMMVTESSFQVISLNEEHTCVRDFKYGNLVNYKWIVKHFGYKIRQNPEIKLHEIADLVLKKYKCMISPCQCRYAKTKSLNEGEITIKEHYAMIRSYGKETLDLNDGSIVKLGVTVNLYDKTYFDRFYCCFYGLKKSFQLGCRHVIALDVCFLMKPNVGEILTVVSRDGNNHIYPIAWVVVHVENKDNWSWFLELFGKDIDMPTGNSLTLMSYQHKGVLEAVKDVMPLVEHKQCARHIYEGFRKQYSGVQFRELFWAASKASYPQLFNKIMQKIKKANPGAHEYLIKTDPKTWSRAFFRIGSNCKSLNYSKRLELNKDKHKFWHIIPAGGNLFEVRNGSEEFTVDEHKRTYTCRMWQLVAKRGRPKKNVATMESGGDATIHIDESSSQVRQEGVATSINVGSVRVKSDTNVGSMRVEADTNVASIGVEDGTNVASGVRRVTSRSTSSARIGRGGQTVGVRRGTSKSTSSARGGVRGRGRQTLSVRYGRLGRWFRLGDEIQKEPNNQPTPLTQQSQAGIQQTAEDGRPVQANQNLRPRSIRIMKKTLSRSIDDTCSC
nr:pentatricopeptide repeat-containing protein [Tanacetum cinerariifolium]